MLRHKIRNGIEQRANIIKLGKTRTETYQMLKKVYGDNCLCRSRIHEWSKRFQEEREALENDERSGRPRNVVNEENAEIVHEFIHQKRAEIIAEIHGIGIRNIRSVDLSYRPKI